MKTLVAACALTAVVGIAPALAADNSVNNPSSSTLQNSAPTSGPGVKGAPGNKNGPAMKQPSDNSGSSGSSGSSMSSGSSGASTGEQGTLPSQDSKGVQGQPGNKNGPAKDTSGSSTTK